MALKTELDLAALVAGAFIVRNAFILIGVALLGLAVYGLALFMLIAL
jgi:hypothetical protein